MNDQLQSYLKVKREEYEFAKKNNLKALQEVTRAAVKKTIKKFNLKLVPGEQQTLF